VERVDAYWKSSVNWLMVRAHNPEFGIMCSTPQISGNINKEGYMPERIMSLADRIIEHHGYSAYCLYLSQFTPPEDGSGRPHFPQYAVVHCADCFRGVHHEVMNFMSSYDTRYTVRVRENENVTFMPVLQGNREALVTALCPSCSDECEWCSDLVRLTGREFTDHMLCEACEDDARQCYGCDRLLNVQNDYYETFDTYGRRDDYWCRRCYADVAVSCDICDETYHQDDDPNCDCHDNSGIIMSYGAMRDAGDRIFHVGCNDDGDTIIIHGQHAFNRSQFVHEPVMGFESECESENADLYQGAELFRNLVNDNRLYLKEDGSLRDGFEIVTHPHTLDMFQNHFDWQPFKDLSKTGFRAYKYHDPSHNHDVGFHIHINRNAFYTKRLHERTSSSPHLYGFLSFIYHNVPAMTRISSRNSHYGTITENELDNIYGYARHRSYGDRSVAVNCRNQHTIELRCFAGALNPARALGYLEFTHALWAYTSTGRISKMKEHHKMDFSAFADWVDHDPKYSNLVSLIKRSDARSSY